MRKLFLACLLAVLAGVGLLGANTLDVYFIDVGQGDAVLIDYGTYELLIDGGADGSCIPFLAEHVDGYLEVVVATHPHSDHIGGLDDVIRAFDVLDVVTNGASADTNAYDNFAAVAVSEVWRVEVVQRNDQIQLGDLVLQVLHPHKLTGDANEDSLVLQLTYQDVSFLFTGDIGEEAEHELLGMECLADIDILKVAHHGSQYSSSTGFLDVVQPEIAIYSAGVGNSYGHPHDDAISRLAASDAQVYGTDQCGTIVVSTDGASYSVDSRCGVQSTQATAQPSSPVATGLLINEVETNPPGSDSGAEWIEIYNPTPEAVSMLGWAASYTGYGGGWDPIPSVTVEAGGYYRFVYPKQHLENSRGEVIRLRNAAGGIVDETPPGLRDQENDSRTWQRIPTGIDSDLLADWVFGTGTPGVAN